MKKHYPNTLEGMQIAAKIENRRMLIQSGSIGGHPYSRFTQMEKQIVQLEEKARVLMEVPPPEQEKEEVAGDTLPAAPVLPVPTSYMEFLLQRQSEEPHAQQS